jgi:hypothetical protein
MNLVRIATLSIAVCALAACSGGSNQSTAGVDWQAQTAQVMLMLAEDSADEANGAYITFSKVSLVPEGSGDPVVIFESEDGREVNFSALADRDLLFSVDDDVEAGTYVKILVAVESIRVKGGVCEDLTTSVPDDEIELLPEKAIEIGPGDKVVIRLAVDSERSVQIKVDSTNEQCIFQPVIDVEIDALSKPVAQDCPTTVSGKVTDLGLTLDLEVVSFVLDLGEDNGTQTVLIGEETGLFGTDGLPEEAADLRIGDAVTAKGRLNDEGEMLADVVIEGETITFQGTVLLGPGEDGLIVVEPDEGSAIVDETWVRYFRETLVLFGCQDATPASLVKGQRVTITGKVAPSGRIFRAAEIAIDPAVVVGAMTSVKEVEGGREISVRPVGVLVETTILVPDDVEIQLEGDGEIPDDLLADLLDCEPLPVRVVLDPDEEDATASSVRVRGEDVHGKVERIDAASRKFLVDETIVEVLSTATIIDLRDDEELGSLADLEIGDCVRVFGLVACEDDDVDFYGFVVLIVEEEKPERPEPERFEGCGVGYWKNHTRAWPRPYTPDTLFDDVFEETFPDKTLLDVLEQGGGGLHALGRQTVAALLNAASGDIHYRFTERAVVEMFNDASPDGTVELLKKRFEFFNEMGCDDDRDERDEEREKDDD